MSNFSFSILSTEHGRMRREERDITKRDLYKAIRHGERKRCWNRRWLIEHDGFSFIVNDSLTTEVTAYPSPLAFAEIGTEQKKEHASAKLVLESKPELMSSHTVLVVDNSGSMTTKDIPIHRCRQSAAYSETALEYVAEQLFKGTSNNSDVVSLIEFNATPTVVFEKEPFSWVLYNKILQRRDTRTYKTRQQSMIYDMLSADSNYLPALEKAKALLQNQAHESLALSLFFLSDGAPTDALCLDITPDAAQRRITTLVEAMALEFEDRFSILVSGFAGAISDFKVLEDMVKSANECNSGSKARFVHCQKIYNSIGSAVSSLVESTTLTRLHLSKASRTDRGIASEKASLSPVEWSFYLIVRHFHYDPNIKDFVSVPHLPYGAINEDDEAKFIRKPPPYLAMKRSHCGKGAERLAFRCRLADRESEDSFKFGPMAAKETTSVEYIQENIAFHKSFCETQSLAAYLATEFNNRVGQLNHFPSETTPKITFLRCSVLLLKDHTWPGGTRGVLVEKMLDVDTYGWCKWNDNAGAVNGVSYHPPIDVDLELARIKQDRELHVFGELLEEEDSDSGSETSSAMSIADSNDDTKVDDQVGQWETNQDTAFAPTDFLHAFSHFTHLFTNRNVLLCDLQGIFKHDTSPPCFELTDPAIHYASKTGRKRVFGRTDLGTDGMDVFFKTHKCTKICKILNLSRKNPHWKKAWKCAESAQAAGFFSQDAKPAAR